MFWGKGNNKIDITFCGIFPAGNRAEKTDCGNAESFYELWHPLGKRQQNGGFDAHIFGHFVIISWTLNDISILAENIYVSLLYLFSSMKKKTILRLISLLMLIIAVIFVACALCCPTLGTTIYIGSFAFGAEQWRVCYALYVFVMFALFGASFFVKEH